MTEEQAVKAQEKILEGNRKLNKLQRYEITARIRETFRQIAAEDYDSADREVNDLGVILEFLFITRELSIEEYNELCDLVHRIAEEAA